MLSGVTLILSTQRSGSDILNGQIRSNLDVRICGRADRILSEIVLGKGNTDAAELIPNDAQGLFLTNSNKVFKGYLFPKNFIEDFTNAERKKQEKMKEKIQGVDNNEHSTNN